MAGPGFTPKHVTPESNAGYCEAKKFVKAGSSSSPEVAVLVNDATNATNVLAITAESVAIAAGAAGTTGTTAFDKAPIYNVVGTHLGCLTDTSVAVTSTDLTTEEAWDYTKTDAEQIALLDNGDYRIDYRTGKVIYKKASTGTSFTANYKTRQTNIEVTAPAVAGLGSVKLEDGTTAANKADVNDANIARTTGTHVVATQQVGADGTVPPTGSLNSNAPFTKVTDGTNNVTLADIGATYGFGVGVFDAAGNRMPTGDAAARSIHTTVDNLAHAEDAAHVTGDIGVQALAVRKDAAGAFGADGDYTPLQVDATGALRITGSVSAATEFAEDSAHTTGDKGMQMLGVQKSANAALSDDGDYACIQISQHGYVKTTVNAIRDAAVAIGSGAIDTGTQRVNLATDDPAVALLGTIDGDTSTIAGDTTSIDGKTPAMGTALMAGSSPVTIATDDTMFTALDTAVDKVVDAVEKMDDWEDALAFADYCKVTTYGDNGAGAPVKMLMDASGSPQVDVLSLPVGSAAMAASTPVTIATDDTMMTALDTAVDKVVAAVEIMDDWDESDRCKIALPATTGFSVDQSAALEASSETKASAGRLYKVFGRIDSTLASGTYYIQLLDAAALPADGAVTHLVTPIKIIHVAGTDSFFELDLTGNNSYSGVAATNGIVIVSSSTEFTKTITAASFSASVLFV